MTRSADTPTSSASATAPVASRYAGLLRRLACLVYEALIVVAILFVGGGVFTALFSRAETLAARIALQLLLIALVGSYFVWCWTRGGQTLPMQTWRIRVVTAVGGELTATLALRRYLYALAGTLLAGVTFFWAFVDRDRQFLHDRLAGTRLVEVNKTVTSDQ